MKRGRGREMAQKRFEKARKETREKERGNEGRE